MTTKELKKILNLSLEEKLNYKEKYFVENAPFLYQAWFANDFNLNIPLAKDTLGQESLSYPQGTPQNETLPTPCGSVGSVLLKNKNTQNENYFVRMYNTLNSCLTSKKETLLTTPYECIIALRIPFGGFVPYEAVTAGSCGLKYINPLYCEVFSSYKGSDNHQKININLTKYADEIVLFNWIFPDSKTCLFNVYSGLYFSIKEEFIVKFPTDKFYTQTTLGSTSHPTITDFFAGCLSPILSPTNKLNILELFDMYLNKKSFTGLKPTIVFNSSAKQFISPYYENAVYTWFKYDVLLDGKQINGIDNRKILQKGLGKNVLNHDLNLLPTNPKSDIVVEVEYKGELYCSTPFNKYW